MASATDLAAAIQALARPVTTPGFMVPVKVSAQLGPMKPGATDERRRRTQEGPGHGEPCQAATPSFAADISRSHAALYAGACHGADYVSQLNLSEGTAYAALVGAKSTEGGKLQIVMPGSIAKSFMARKILGHGLNAAKGNGSMMPQGCPGLPPAGGCLTPAEEYTILAWIQSGAPNN